MKARILVVDDNKKIVDMLKESFESNKKIDFVLSAYDGDEAVKIIREKEDDFDLILLDLVMPNKDGMYVLKYMKENKINKNIIVMTSYNEEQTIREVSEYGVRYYVLKPFEIKDLEEKIIDISESKKENERIIDIGSKEMQIKVTNLLHELGMPSHIKGYQYIRTAILMVLENPGYIGGITKELYPNLSVKFGTSVSRVERAIRHAIETSWVRGDISIMDSIFGNSVEYNRSKPTNSEFIVTIADKLRLEMIDRK